MSCEVSEVNYMQQFFSYKHLPEHLQTTSKQFAELAMFLETLPKNPESQMAFRKLLEAKDCAVRSQLFK